jgi:hypothetical protein
MNFERVMSHCVHSALFMNIVILSILNEPRELQHLGCRR